jgi:hypothetical protein
MTNEMPPFGNYADPQMRRALAWFVDLMPVEEWASRRKAIEDHIEAMHATRKSREEAQTHGSFSIQDDRMGWYLYLMDALVNDVFRYETGQGSRVAPILHQIGHNFDAFLQLRGVREKVLKILGQDRSNPDSTLFEILIALLWAKNGFDVEFIPETPGARTPDLRARKGRQEWFVECKRLQKSSQYSLDEREKWLRMWVPFRNFLLDSKFSAVFEIVFHVPLESLPDDYVVSQLSGKVRLVQLPCIIVSNETWSVSAYEVDYDSFHRHLSKYMVLYPSEQLSDLVAGKRVGGQNFTSVVMGKFERAGEGKGVNRYLDEVGFAAGAFWGCDNQGVIERKARDIRGRLSDAVRQLPAIGKCAVHVALETLDGAEVEMARLLRILQTVAEFDASDKDLRWIYCHTVQSHSPPDQAWAIDETTHHFGKQNAGPEPLTTRAAWLPSDADAVEGVHWLRPPP